MWLNSLWSQKDNFISVPTDCPQRDERLGWTGDAQVFLRTSMCNMDVAAFFTKWMVDIEDAQTSDGVFPDTAPRLREDINFVGLPNLAGAAGWADAGVIIPFTLWRLYGDRRIIQKHYSAMVHWVDWISKKNPSGLRVNELSNNYGDWLCIPSYTSFGTQSPMKNLLATAFWADDCNKLSQMAAALGNTNHEQRFKTMFEWVRGAFQKEWLLPDGQLAVETQTAYLLALAFDLLPSEVRGAAAERLVANIRELDWHLSTGFIGVGLLNPQLTLAGHNDVAYRLLFQDTYPAWLYPVKHGATTIWERWNGWTADDGFYDPHMNSFNHYSLGSVVEWLFRHVAGIELETEVAGCQYFILCPYISKSRSSSSAKLEYTEVDYVAAGLNDNVSAQEGLDWVRANLRTMYGDIESFWQQDENGLKWKVRIPSNTEADVGVPSSCPDQIMLDGKPLSDSDLGSQVSGRAGRCWLRLHGGNYEFKVSR